MDTTQYAESEYVTPELVKSSPSKTAVIVSEALPDKTDYGEKLTCQVEIDGKQKKWRLNRDSVKNMQQIGKDSKTWMSHIIRFMVVTTKGKECVIGVPQ